MLQRRKIVGFGRDPADVQIGREMSRLHRIFRIAPALAPRAVAVLMASACPAGAQEAAGYRALWPLPRPALTRDEPDGVADLLARDAAADPEGDADAVLIAPAPMGGARPGPAGGGPVAARGQVPLEIIGQGLSPGGPVATALPERAVGLKLGADTFAVSTRLVTPAGAERGADARIDWRLAHPVAASQTGLIWSVATGGSSGMTLKPEQNANLLVGFRQPIFAHLTLTSQLTMQGSYIFAPGEGAHSALVPEVRLSASLNGLADLPFEADVDLGLARQMPVMASQPETRGSAMLRLKYALD